MQTKRTSMVEIICIPCVNDWTNIVSYEVVVLMWWLQEGLHQNINLLLWNFTAAMSLELNIIEKSQKVYNVVMTHKQSNWSEFCDYSNKHYVHLPPQMDCLKSFPRNVKPHIILYNVIRKWDNSQKKRFHKKYNITCNLFDNASADSSSTVQLR